METWKQGGVSLGWFLTAAQCGFYSLVSFLGRLAATAGSRKWTEEAIGSVERFAARSMGSKMDGQGMFSSLASFFSGRRARSSKHADDDDEQPLVRNPVTNGDYGVLISSFPPLDGLSTRSSTAVKNDEQVITNVAGRLQASTEQHGAPWKSFALIGAMSMMTIGLSNTAIEYVSYPTQVAFKSAKPIPVLIGSVIILNKKFDWLEIWSTVCLVVGLMLFTTADSLSRVDLTPSVGVALLLVALTVDGVIGNVQQRTFGKYNVAPTEMIMKTKGFASILALMVCILQGQLGVAIEFTTKHPESITPVLIYCVSGVIGEVFVMMIIKRFGALAAVIVTSVRKGLTMSLSFFLFSRPWTNTYALAAFMLWTGVATHVYAENRLKKKSLDAIV